MLENLYNDSSDENGYESEIESSSDSSNNSILSDSSLPLHSDSSSDSSSSFSSSQSFSSDSSSFNSSSSTSASSFPRRRESPKHRVRRYVSIFKKRPVETRPPETPPPLPQEPIKSTSSSSSNTDFSSSYSSESDDMSTSTEDNKDIITSASVETSTEDLNKSFSDSLSSSSIDVEIQTDLEDQAHQDKIKELEGGCDKLTEDLGKIQQEKGNLEIQLMTLRSELSRKDNELSTLTTETKQQKQINAELQQQKADLEESIGRLNKNLSDLTTQRDQLKTQLETNKEKLRQVEGELQNVTDEVTRLTESLDKSNTAKEAAEGQVNQKEKDLASRDKKINETEEALQDKKNEAQRLQEKLTTTEQQVRELNGKITEQAEELAKLRENLAEEQTKSAQYIQEIENTIQEQRIQQEKSTDEINRLQAENDQQRKTNAEVQKQKAGLEQDIERLNIERGTLTINNNGLNTQLNDQQEENKKLQDKLAQAKPDTVTIGMQTEGEMAITKRMANIQKSSNTITVTDKAGKKTLTFKYDSEINKYVVSLENHTTTSLIIDKDIMENFRKQYKKLNLEQQGELFGQAYSYLMNADRPSLRFGTNKPLVQKSQQLPENQQQIITSRSKSRLLALPATNTQPWPQDNGKEGDINFGYDSNSKEIYYKGIRVFFRDNKESKRYKYVGNLGDSSPFSSEQKAAIEKISRKKHKNQIQDVQKALQELANSVPLVAIENRHTTEAKKTIDGDKHHYRTGDLAVSKELRNQDNTIKTIPSTINTSRSFSPGDLSLPKPRLQINEQNLKNALKKAIRTKSMPNLSIPEASTKIQVSSTTSPSIAETPAISKANLDVDLLNHLTGNSTVVSSPSVSGSLTRTSSQTSLLTAESTATLPPAVPLSGDQSNKQNSHQFLKFLTLPAPSLQHVSKSEVNKDAPETQSAIVSLTQSPAKATELNIKEAQDGKGKDCHYVFDPWSNKIFKRGIHKRLDVISFIGVTSPAQYDDYYHIKKGYHRTNDIEKICKKNGFNNTKLTEYAVKKIMQALYSAHYDFD